MPTTTALLQIHTSSFMLVSKSFSRSPPRLSMKTAGPLIRFVLLGTHTFLLPNVVTLNATVNWQCVASPLLKSILPWLEYPPHLFTAQVPFHRSRAFLQPSRSNLRKASSPQFPNVNRKAPASWTWKLSGHSSRKRVPFMGINRIVPVELLRSSTAFCQEACSSQFRNTRPEDLPSRVWILTIDSNRHSSVVKDINCVVTVEPQKPSPAFRKNVSSS